MGRLHVDQPGRTGSPPSLHVARSFYGAAMLATNDNPQWRRRMCEQCAELSRALDFDEGLAWSLMWIGCIDTRQRNVATVEMFRASLVHGRRLVDPWRQAFLLAQALICCAGCEALMGRDGSAEAMVAACEAEMATIGGDKPYIGHGRALLGTIAIRRSLLERAGELLAKSLALYRSVASKFDIAGSDARPGSAADCLRRLQGVANCSPLGRGARCRECHSSRGVRGACGAFWLGEAGLRGRTGCHPFRT